MRIWLQYYSLSLYSMQRKGKVRKMAAEVFMCCLSCSIHQCFGVRGLDLPEALCRGRTRGDLFIWLLPSKLARPLDRWPLCPSSRQPVRLSGTKRSWRTALQGPQLLSFTFPARLHFITLPPSPITPSTNSSCRCIYYSTMKFPWNLFYFHIFTPLCCWSSDANLASDLLKINLNKGSVVECICVHYAWVPL